MSRLLLLQSLPHHYSSRRLKPKPPPGFAVSSANEQAHWRSIGPYIGGRVRRGCGRSERSEPLLLGRRRRRRLEEHRLRPAAGRTSPTARSRASPIPIGAIAVAPSNPSVIYAGTGEADIRSDFDTGDGVYKTTDAGKTWTYAGLRDTHMIAKHRHRSAQPQRRLRRSMGHVFKPNPERGIFKTTDGGKTWHKILFVDDKTGGIDLAMDPHDPTSLYAAMWQAQRQPWKLTSGGPGSGLYKTTDGGAHWTKISTNPGFATGTLGKIGVCGRGQQPAHRLRDRAGKRRRRLPLERRRRHVEARQRRVEAAPARLLLHGHLRRSDESADVAYAPNVDGVYKTKNGGKTWTELHPPHGDNHIVWINPRNPKILLVGDDGGGDRLDRRRRHIGAANTISRRDSSITSRSTISFRSTSSAHRKTKAPSKGRAPPSARASARRVARGRARREHVRRARARRPRRHVRQRLLQLVRARSTGSPANAKNVSPWPRYMAGVSSGETKYRFGWTHPIFFSPADPHELLVAAQVVFSSMDHGQTWKIHQPRSDAQRSQHRRTDRRSRSTTIRPARRRFPTSRRSRFRRSTPTCSGRARPTDWCT